MGENSLKLHGKGDILGMLRLALIHLRRTRQTETLPNWDSVSGLRPAMTKQIEESTPEPALTWLSYAWEA
jgi:hypothetical protein